MQYDVKRPLAPHEFAADLDVVALGRLRAEIGADAAVDRDAACGDQLIAMPPGTEAGGGQKAVQAHGEVTSDK